MKIGMHVSVRETGARGVLVALDGETATVRLRGEDKALLAEETSFALSEIKGEKGRPVHADKLRAAPEAPPAGE
jgi:hypothetical protein